MDQPFSENVSVFLTVYNFRVAQLPSDDENGISVTEEHASLVPCESHVAPVKSLDARREQWIFQNLFMIHN